MMHYNNLKKLAGIFILMSCILVYAQKDNSPGEIFQGEKNAAQYSSEYHITGKGTTLEHIDRLNANYEAAKKDLEIAILKDKEIARADLWTSAVIAVLSANLLIILFIIRHHRKRRREFEAEKKLKEFELLETKTRLSHNARLVDGFTQRILDKNKIIAELEKKIRSNPLWNQSAENARRNLAAITELRILTQDDWNKFQSNVNKVYPGLINRICDSFPLITDAELRMFLLIKLSVKNKDVSEILGISPDSVRKTRFRLKKKLNLAEEEDLDDFILDYNGSDDIIPREKLN